MQEGQRAWMHALCVRRFSNAVQIRRPGRKMRGQIPSVRLAATLAVYQCKFVPVREGTTAHVCRLISANVDVRNDRIELKCFTFNKTISPFRNSGVPLFSCSPLALCLIFSLEFFQDKVPFSRKTISAVLFWILYSTVYNLDWILKSGSRLFPPLIPPLGSPERKCTHNSIISHIFLLVMLHFK